MIVNYINSIMKKKKISLKNIKHHLIHKMNIRNFDLNLLLVFKTLFEERNVTRASKKIGITQPAMSNALNRLRYLLKMIYL